MSEPSRTDAATAPAPSFQMVGSDEALVCEDGVCAVPTSTTNPAGSGCCSPRQGCGA